MTVFEGGVFLFVMSIVAVSGGVRIRRTFYRGVDQGHREREEEAVSRSLAHYDGKTREFRWGDGPDIIRPYP
jgi:hypothetical protein